jgi:hypothetical protein
MPTTDQPYYPALSDLITVEDLPASLSFIKGLLSDILNKIYYKNYQGSKSIGGNGAYYSLDVVSRQKLEIEIPGTGIYLVLNPDYTDDTISSFPITLMWQWDIIRYLNEFNITGFSFSVSDMFNLALTIFNVTEEQALKIAAYTFVIPSDPSVSVFGQLVADINNLYGASIVIDEAEPSPYLDLASQIDALGESIPAAIITLYLIGDPVDMLPKLNAYFSIFIPSDLQDYIVQLATPTARATLELSAALEFPRSILLPMIHNPDSTYTPDNSTDPSGNLKTAYIQFAEAFLDIDTQTGFGYQTDFSGTLVPQYVQIASTCFIISFSDVKLDLSTTTNIPEADAAGYPVGFVGAYIGQAAVILNGLGTDDSSQQSVSLAVKNFLVGTGGVSGTITFADTGLLYRNFGDFAAGLDTFSLTFKQGIITNCAISGKVTLPANFSPDGTTPVTLEIDVAIKDAGDFSITAKPLGTLPSFTLPNVFTVTLRQLTLGEKDGRFFIMVAGTLDFIADVPVLGDVLPKGITINKLIIWDNGDLEFDGGGLVIPKAFKLQVGPVKLEVSHLSMSSTTRKLNGVDRKYTYVGFDGMVNTGTAGIEAAGNGIKYYFTTDDGPGRPFDNFVSIDGIAIDIKVPGEATEDDAAFILQGFLSMKNPDPDVPDSTAGVEYTGKVTFELPKIDVEGTAAMRLKPSVPSFLVDLGVELPMAIPLGPTGLGIYALRGLIGQHYLPSKAVTTPPLPDTASWWEYYKAKSIISGREGIEVDKFASESGFSIGAGVSLATDLADSGYIFSAKLFLLLGLPDVFLIQGQAGIIQQRLGLDQDVDPPFQALIVFSSDSILGDLSVNFNVPLMEDAKGFILSVQAQLSMGFFFNNASGWYINLGKDTPASAQVQAKILTLFKGHAFLMISSQGIKAGAGASFDFSRSFGPVGIGFNAYLNMGGSISFKPAQIGAFLQVGGGAYVKILGRSISLSIAIAFAVEAPHPFNLIGSLHIQLKVIIVKININLDVSWRFNNTIAALNPNPVLSLPDARSSYAPVAAKNILTNEVFQVNYVNNSNVGAVPIPGDPSWQFDFTDVVEVTNVVIPLDSFIDIELLKPVLPGSTPIGGGDTQLPVGYTELIPPQKGASPQIKHQYGLVDLEILAWGNNGSEDAWMPYNIYEAVTAIADGNTGDGAIDLDSLQIGYWQFTVKDQYSKIRLLSQNMFSFMNGTTLNQGDLDAKNFMPGDVFCFNNITSNTVIDWKSVETGTVYPDDTPALFKLVSFNFNTIAAGVETEASFGSPALRLTGGKGTVTMTFPEPVTNISLQIGDNSNDFTINLIQTLHTAGPNGTAIATPQLLGAIPVTSAQHNETVDTVLTAIDQVQIVFSTPGSLDYEGDLVIGGHYPLAPQFISAGLNGAVELDKALLFATLYNRSFSPAAILAMDYLVTDGVAAQWPMDSLDGSTGGLNGLLSGSPDKVPGFFEADETGAQELHEVFSYGSNADAFLVPYDPLLKVENDSFTVDITAVFDPFAPGISTLIYKVDQDGESGYKKGFALHLVQNSPASADVAYTTAAAIPQFTVLLTCYHELSVSGVTAQDSYTIDCATSKAVATQYKRIIVVVDRTAGLLAIYIDKIQCYSGNIPAELSVFGATEPSTFLNQVSYLTQSEQARLDDSGVTETSMIDQLQLLSDTLNKTIQPVWRPDTIYALKITTQDKVQATEFNNTQVFGFKTAGPLGHFHQQSQVYQQLLAQDQADAFKLASLQFYIDYERSFPDAQGRYNLSKPVLYGDPQVRLFFTEPYINAMYTNWDAYQGMPAVGSSLQPQFIDPYGNVIIPALVPEPPLLTPITMDNYKSLPRDQQTIFLFNQAASQSGCDPQANLVTKRMQFMKYQFPALQPGKLYTALFNAVYQPEGSDPDSVQVHKFSFISSRYATFQEQAGSYILDTAPGQERYAIYPTRVSFSPDYIDHTLKPLIDIDPANDPSAVLQYAVPYDRLIYGGLQLPAPEPIGNTVIQLIINTDPDDDTLKTLLGLMVYNPEPFNDPKLPADELAGTVQLSMTLPDSSTLDPGSFIYIYSGDTSGVFITNTAMAITPGSISLDFFYKIFNGIDYDIEQYPGGPVDITPYF